MVSKEQIKRTTLHEKLQLLRSVTNSHSQDKASIIVHASKYIRELKKKVEELNDDIASTDVGGIGGDNTPPVTSPGRDLAQVTVATTQEKSFLINVFSEKSCPGLLVSTLKAFEELGLDVLEARVSCADPFRLVAVGVKSGTGFMDVHLVKQVVLQAIEKCREQG